MKMGIYGALLLAALSSCGGPNQQAGERQDEAAANRAGETYTGTGPAERVGRAQDQADRASIEARRATKAALAARSDNYRRQVEVGAVRLEEQARELRQNADARGEQLKAEEAAIARK